MQGSRGRLEVHYRVRRQQELQGAPAPDFSGHKDRADLGQQHRQRAGRPGAAIRPQGVQQDGPLDRLCTVCGEVRDQQPPLPAGKPRLDRLPVDHDSQPEITP